MQKLGMKPVPNISRVTIKKSKNVGPTAQPIFQILHCHACAYRLAKHHHCMQALSALPAASCCSPGMSADIVMS